MAVIVARVTTRERTLWSPLRHRDLRFLVTGLGISQIGDWLYNVALIVFVYDRTGSATWVAAAGIVRLLPYTLFGTIGGMIADRWSRKRVMIASDVIRSAVMVGLALVAATEGSAAPCDRVDGTRDDVRRCLLALRERGDAYPRQRG